MISYILNALGILIIATLIVLGLNSIKHIGDVVKPEIETCFIVQLAWGGEFNTPSNKMAEKWRKRGHTIVDVPCKPIYYEHSH